MYYIIAFHLISASIVLILSQFVKEIDENEQIWKWIITSYNRKGLF